MGINYSTGYPIPNISADDIFVYSVTALDSTRSVIVGGAYYESTSTTEIFAVVATESGGAISYGTEEVLFSTSYLKGCSSCQVDSSNVLIAVTYSPQTDPPFTDDTIAVVASVFGDTIAFGSLASILSVNEPDYMSVDLSLCGLSSTTALCTIYNIDLDNQGTVELKVINISGMYVSAGASTSLSATGNFAGVGAVNETQGILVLDEGFGVRAKVVDTFGGLSFGSSYILSDNPISGRPKFTSLSSGNVVISYIYDNYGAGLMCCCSHVVATISGSSISLGSAYTPSNSYGVSYNTIIADNSSTVFLAYDNGQSTIFLLKLGISGNAISLIESNSISITGYAEGLSGDSNGSGKFLIAFNDNAVSESIIVSIGASLSVYVKSGGTWVPATAVYVKNNGAWQPSTSIYVKSNGIWQT